MTPSGDRTRYLARYVGQEPILAAGYAWIHGTERVITEAIAHELAAHGYFRVTALPPKGCG